MLIRREHSSSVHVPQALDEISLCIHPGGGKPWAYTQDLEPRSRPEFRLGKSRAEKICSVFKRRFPAMRPCGWQGEAGNRGTARRQPVDKPWSTRLRWIGSLPHREAPRWRRTSQRERRYAARFSPLSRVNRSSTKGRSEPCPLAPCQLGAASGQTPTLGRSVPQVEIPRKQALG